MGMTMIKRNFLGERGGDLLNIHLIQIYIGVIHPRMPPDIVLTWGVRGSLDWTTERRDQCNQ